MALILMVNLAFSIVGFWFILRMWHEVKNRRDEYGENFNIPRGKRRKKARRSEPVEVEADYEEFYDEYEEQKPVTVDDLQKMMLQIAESQKGGANA